MIEPDHNELSEFLRTQADNQSAAPWPKAIEKDLVVSRLRLSINYVLGAALGYILSLVVCAQCSVGLSPFAWKTAFLLHQMPDPWCPMLCGVVFGFVPTVVTILQLSRFQHRFLIFRMGWLPALVPVISSILLLASGDPHGWTWRLIWILAAICTPYVLELGAAWVLRQGQWKAH